MVFALLRRSRVQPGPSPAPSPSACARCTQDNQVEWRPAVEAWLCGKCVGEVGSGALALVVPAAFAAGLIALAATTGKLAWAARHLPLTPTPNGFTLLCLTVLAGGCWWRLARVETPPYEMDLWPDLDQDQANQEAEDTDAYTCPDGGWWLSTEAARGTDGFLDLDPDEALPTLLPKQVTR